MMVRLGVAGPHVQLVLEKQFIVSSSQFAARKPSGCEL
jgi:hypothetical protein